MTATEELIAEVVRLPWALGNAVLALETLFSAIERERHAEKRLLYAALAELVSGGARLFTQAERRWLRERLDGRVEPAKLVGDVEPLKRLVELAPAAEEALVPAGQVNVLCVSSAPFLGGPFGVVQRLDVQRFRTAEGPVLNRKADDQAVFLGFRAGVIAGQAYILRRALGDELFAPVPGEGDTFKGEFPNLPSGLSVNGPSLGLGAAMAVVSLMLDLPLPGDVAFTGEIDVHGRLARVTGIPEKLRAAADKGIRVAYLPRENTGDFSAGLGIDIRPVTTLEDVVTEIFDNASVARQLARLSAAAGSDRSLPGQPAAIEGGGSGRGSDPDHL